MGNDKNADASFNFLIACYGYFLSIKVDKANFQSFKNQSNQSQTELALDKESLHPIPSSYDLSQYQHAYVG